MTTVVAIPAPVVPESVPDRSHYSLGYFRGGRMFSYAHQMEAVLSLGAESVLEIGVGAGVVAAALRATGLHVVTLDIEVTLHPDLLGSVTAIPLGDGSVDAVLCCQVLEHLPFERVAIALAEMRRVCSKGMILSLPDRTRWFQLGGQLPLIGRKSIGFCVPRIRTRAIGEEYFRKTGHFWEIGIKGFPLSKVEHAISDSGWSLDRTWRVPEMPWHRFFELRA